MNEACSNCRYWFPYDDEQTYGSCQLLSRGFEQGDIPVQTDAIVTLEVSNFSHDFVSGAVFSCSMHDPKDPPVGY